MKKVKIFSGAATVPLLICFWGIEIGCLILCLLAKNVAVYILFALWSIMLCAMMLLTNRTMTIITYDPENGIVTRRGIWGGFHRELRVADIIRTEVLMIPKEQEYIFLIDRDTDPRFESLSANTPIRVPNNAKGRSFVALFYSSLD